jgi:hypothetical protein
MGNYHVRFLGGKGAERPLTYPVCDTMSRFFDSDFNELYLLTNWEVYTLDNHLACPRQYPRTACVLRAVQQV